MEVSIKVTFSSVAGLARCRVRPHPIFSHENEQKINKKLSIIDKKEKTELPL